MVSLSDPNGILPQSLVQMVVGSERPCRSRYPISAQTEQSRVTLVPGDMRQLVTVLIPSSNTKSRHEGDSDSSMRLAAWLTPRLSE